MEESCAFESPVTLFADPRREEVTAALRRIRQGATPEDVETVTLDCKEDKSRRDRRGALTEGDPRHEGMAQDIADAAACLANSHGGSIVVGLIDKVGGPAAFLGTPAEPDWLRRRIWDLTDPNLTVDVVASVDQETGARLLAVFVPPPTGTAHRCGRRYTHRVGTSCVEMKTADHVAVAGRFRDWSEMPSVHTVQDVDPAALGAARVFARAPAEPTRQALAGMTDTDLLASLQVLRDGVLTNAGALLFVSRPDMPVRLDYLRRLRPGGETRRRLDRPGSAVLAAFADIEQAFQVENANPSRHGMTRTLDELVPAAAAREAIVNAIMHRDWEAVGSIMVEHSGSQLVVTSPGGFADGVDATNVLTTVSRTRNPHLASVLRSLRLAEREAIGVDRMYREMIMVGHNPPEIAELDSAVRCVLIGGEPVQPVRELTSELSPEAREDVDIALVVHHLLHQPRVDARRLQPAVQKTLGQAEDALRRAAVERVPRTAQSVTFRPVDPNGRPLPDVPGVGGMPLIEPARGDGGTYRFGEGVRRRLRGRLAYVVERTSAARPFVVDLLRGQDRVRAADVIELCSVTSVQASRVLGELRADGVLQVGSAHSVGQGVFYVRGPRFPA